MAVKVQEVDDISDHCWRFFSLLEGTIHHEVSPKSSWFFDIGEFRCQVRAVFWVGEGSCSRRSAGSVLSPLVQVVTEDQS
jgi:hypothetical protein